MRGTGLFFIFAFMVIGPSSHASDPVEILRGHHRTSRSVDPFFSPHSWGGRTLSRNEKKGFSASQFAENELCRNAYVAEFSVEEGIDSLPVNADYCELKSELLPPTVQTVLERLRILHLRYAATLGVSPDALFNEGVHLRFAVDPAGPFMSRSRYEIEMVVFSDFKAEVFPEKIYAHELTHWLTNHQPSFGDSIRLLEPTYLFQEGFPDLVASYVSRSTKIDLSDSSIRPELMASLSRDGTPLKTMKAPFRVFYLGTFQSDVINVCRKIPVPERTKNEDSLCKSYESEQEVYARKGGIYAGSTMVPLTERKLALPFQAKNCLIRYRDGSAGFDACAGYSFSPVLISFFHSIDSVLGSRPMSLLLRAIDEASPSSSKLVCGFDAAGTEAVSFKTPSFVAALKMMRSFLDAPAQVIFDSQWKTHGLDVWEEIESYDRKLQDEPFAYSQLVLRNEAFAARNNCGSKKVSGRKASCRFTCHSIQAPK